MIDPSKQKFEPELDQLAEFLLILRRESDRGAALVAAAMLDERLKEILESFFVQGTPTKDLLAGFNAPLGTFSSRCSAAIALGLIQQNEYREINIIRKIRNEFGHGWKEMSFNSQSVSALAETLPWLGPVEAAGSASSRERFDFAVSILLVDLLWRVRLVGRERRIIKIWPNKSNMSRP